MRYILLFVGLAAAPQATDRATADYNRQWGAWMSDLAANGGLIVGSPLAASATSVTAAGARPFELEPVDIGGFALIDVTDEQQAVEAARKAPHIALGGTTVVRQLIAPAP